MSSSKINRVGLLMKKVGCTSVYDANCNLVPITLLELENNVVLSSSEEGDRNVVKISFGDLKRVNKPQNACFEKLGIEKKGRIKEFRVPNRVAPKPMDSFSVEHFKVGQFVDVVGTSIGKGFAGGMKRHNFGGLRASHGVSIAHRSSGSTGQCQDPGKVFKGKKMPGHLGARRVTVQNLFVYAVYSDRNLIAIKGAVPGCKSSYVLVKDAVKKMLF